MTIHSTPKRAWHAAEAGAAATLFHGDAVKLLAALPDKVLDLTMTSPPYCMGKEYESARDVATFSDAHRIIIPEVVRATRPGGSICWQVGNYVRHGEVVPLDFLVYEIMSKFPEMRLRNRVVWSFGHGLHCKNRFSGRYETVLWFTKEGAPYTFDLDAVRVPQKYPGKRSNKGPNKGELSGNPLGKNPGDIWDIPNVKAQHVEKTEHPCQYPVGLAQRFVRALTKPGDIVFDPFSGVASTGVAALLDGRRFLGSEVNKKYVNIAETRLQEAVAGTARVRPVNQHVREPSPTERVAQRPVHFKS